MECHGIPPHDDELNPVLAEALEQIFEVLLNFHKPAAAVFQPH
jgi:hypothetical protein